MAFKRVGSSLLSGHKATREAVCTLPWGPIGAGFTYRLVAAGADPQGRHFQPDVRE